MWREVIELTNLEKKLLGNFAEWMHMVPSPVCKFIDPKVLINKVTARKKGGKILKSTAICDIKFYLNLFYLVGGVRRLNMQMGNPNVQKIAVCMEKFQDHFYSSDNKFEGYYEGIDISNTPNIIKIDTILQKEDQLNLSEIFNDILHFLILKKIEILNKNKGSLRMKLDELIAFDSLITDALEENPKHTKEYLKIYTLFAEHFRRHPEGYRLNEDVEGIVKFIYSSHSPYISKIRSKIIPKSMNFVNTFFKQKVYHPDQDDDSEEINQLSERSYVELYYEEEELFNLIDNIYASLPKNSFARNNIQGMLEEKLNRKFDQLSPGLIFSLLKKLHSKQDGVSYDTLVKLEKQFLSGKIYDLYPNQISNLMKICSNSECSK